MPVKKQEPTMKAPLDGFKSWRPRRRNKYKSAYNLAMKLMSKFFYVAIIIALVIWLYLVTL